MKVLLIGANGQLGTDLLKVLLAQGFEVTGVGRRDLDICDFAAACSTIDSFAPGIVISTAAFHKVEECDKHPERSLHVNALAIENLAKCCSANDTLFVHFSTDYVFDGSKQSPYDEFDSAFPLNIYGTSKLAGENMIPIRTGRYLIIRTSGLYGVAGSSGKGGNFVEMMLNRACRGERVRVVTDQVLTPTYTLDLARKVTDLICTGANGLFHISSEGQASWYEFTRAIYELERLQVDVAPVQTSDFPSPVVRPRYSVLSKNRLYELGISPMPHWRDALARYLVERRGIANGV